MILSTYSKKREFSKTPEPKPKNKKSKKENLKSNTLQFVVQEHHASHLHFDFRLELNGVLKSWAVPKGLLIDPGEKHLAIQVEDHPYEYRKFHGLIPKGNYGAGEVIIWDKGTYEPQEKSESDEKTLSEQLKKGDLKIILHGNKLNGKYALVKFGKEEKNWLIIKEREDNLPQLREIQTGKKSKMPERISPMLAKLSENVFDSPNFIYELTWDGYRCIAHIENGQITLLSRNNIKFNKNYPEIVESLRKINKNAILDGEIVAIDKNGLPNFQLLQDYLKNKEGATIIYYVFDLLYYDREDLRDLKLTERKNLLKKILPIDAHVKYSDEIDTQGSKLLQLAHKKGLEGIMAKRKDSRYVSLRSDNWQKIKNIQIQEAIICGFTKPKGRREEFGALILGIYKDKKLTYIGHTGGGFDRQKLKDVMQLLKPLVVNSSPFEKVPKTNASPTWVKPKIVAQIKFASFTKEGIMRQPIFLGIRTDKTSKEVTEEIKAEDMGEFSNLDKIFWPKEKYTKGNLIKYYDKISDFILPYLKDRPESLNRHPNGITGESFFQKDITYPPKWLTTFKIHSDIEDKTINWLVCNDKKTLLYMANLGCIEINPWPSRIHSLDKPDYLIIDLDPNGADFKHVLKTALELKGILDSAKIDSFVKTSGKTGLHIFLPLGAKYSYDQTRKFAEVLANIVSSKLPDTTSVIRNPKKRIKKVYIDFLQNRLGATITAPYSVRPVTKAQVSTPLEWEELKKNIKPSDFTMKNIFNRLQSKKDVWKGFLDHKGIDILKSLNLLKV